MLHHPMHTAHLLELLLQHRCQVLGDLERLDGDSDGGNTFGWLPIDGVLGDAFLDGDVVRILGEEVRHGTWVLGLQLLDVGLVIVVGHVVTEDLFAGFVRDGGVGVGSSASVGRDADLVAVLGGDGELDLVKVGEFLAGWSGESLQGGEFLVGLDGFDVVDADVVEADQERQFVDGHVLEHAFGVTLEALAQRLRRVLVGVVGDEGDVGSVVLGGVIACFRNVLAHVLVVSHEDLDAGGFGLHLHLLELGDGRRTWLLQVDALAAVGDALGEQTRVVGGTSRNQGKTRCGRWRQLCQTGSESGSVLELGRLLPSLEVLSGRRVGSASQEPWFDDVVHGCAWALLLKHLHGMVPSHAAVWCTASNENNFGLSLFGEFHVGATERALSSRREGTALLECRHGTSSCCDQCGGSKHDDVNRCGEFHFCVFCYSRMSKRKSRVVV
mmetsp:Transcript_21175/g.60450  ORF Transcript_21175/g.60450 Transcript_21175/m.60450 type:complete len:441 (+) Transcript_21175:121-1443(+)